MDKTLSNHYPTLHFERKLWFVQPRTLHCVATAILITKAPGLIWLCPVLTQHTQTLPSHPTLRQGGCSCSSSTHHRPASLRAHVRHIPCRYKSPLPLSSGGGVGVTNATSQGSIYLFPLLICLQWYHLPAGRYSLYELGRWVLINIGSVTGRAWVDSPKLDCVAWNLNLSLSCPSVTNTHTIIRT